MEYEQIAKKVEEIVTEQLGLNSDGYGMGNTFKYLGADSLDRVEITMIFEEQFQLEISDETAESLNTPAKAIAHIYNTLASIQKGLNDAVMSDAEPVGEYHGKNPLEKLHPGEPYFFLRAQDKCATSAVMHYANNLQREGDRKGYEECMAFAMRMNDWQNDNPDLVKMPD